MKHLRKPRFWLLTTAALIFGSHMSAAAQTSNVYQPGAYQAGAPTMVAAAPSLPNIPADQIARDVAAEHNPRTGRTELVAAPFDPFEEDPQLAGSLRLRSADGAIAIDGQRLSGGALVDVDFYYNSPSDDPYGGRNYSDAAFVSGELAPVVLRDTRILECSTRVENVAYNHTTYYSPSSHSRYGIYQPYRHYTGHSAFGFGYGSSYFGPGINFFNNNRSRLNRNSNNTRSVLPRVNTPNTGNRRSRVRRGRVTPSLRDRNGSAVRTNDETAPVRGTPSPAVRAAAAERREMRLRLGVGRPTAENFRPRGAARRDRTVEPRLTTARTLPQLSATTPSPRSQARTLPTTQRTTPRLNSVFGRRGTAQGRARQSVSEPNIPKQSRSNQNRPKQSVKKSSPKRSESNSKRSESKKSSNKRSNSRTNSSQRSKSTRTSNRSSQSSRSSSIRSRQLDFFPNDGFGGRGVVTSRSVDCAREDKLSVFIPHDRLDAARFDGLTLIALDAQGGETPIYIPPNYIQGYRLATTGRVQPQGISQQGVLQPGFTSAPQTQPRFQEPRVVIEPASCPVGTQLQPNGTCLQTSQLRYPTR